jgi:hypothetical protein
MPGVHFTDEQITQFRDGVLWNPVVAGHLRSCSVCQNRLRDARLLRALLARPEQKKSAHPIPEELAYFLEGRPVGMAFTKIEAHVAGCPQCFADLQAIRDQLQPGSLQEERAPEWVVARAVREFHPPEARLNLGTLLVHWFDKLGPWLRLLPPQASHLVPPPAVEWGVGQADYSARPSVSSSMSTRARRLARSFEPAEPSGGEVFDVAHDAELTPHETEPITFTVGHLNVQIIPGGHARDRVTLTVAVTRTTDNTPVPAVQLSLEGDEGARATATTGDNGIAEVLLPQGQATLAFLSPVRAELKISF